jgi:glyoxylase-like metal-dependent hydrolase (beta-lactamase superfamily II)
VTLRRDRYTACRENVPKEATVPDDIILVRAGANCYLLRGEDGFLLIDTGPRMSRKRLLRGLRDAGCGMEDLRLIVLTHADVDHAGNCAFLQERSGAQVLAHEAEARAVESGAVGWNRKEDPDRLPRIMKSLSIFARGLARLERFSPGVRVEDGMSLSQYGFDATLLHLPGHSRGSVGLLTDRGELFCGDLLLNLGRRPRVHPILDDLADAEASLRRLRDLPIVTVYPGHGKPFPASQLPSI